MYHSLSGKFDYQTEEIRNLVCSYAGCDLYSLPEQVSRASKQPEESMIVTPATVWVDDYVDWLDPKNKCCFRKNCCPLVERPTDDQTYSFWRAIRNGQF